VSLLQLYLIDPELSDLLLFGHKLCLQLFQTLGLLLLELTSQEIQLTSTTSLMKVARARMVERALGAVVVVFEGLEHTIVHFFLIGFALFSFSKLDL
jgi:hypothetical protein